VLHKAYVDANVRELAVLSQAWFTDPEQGPCFKTQIRVEVIPKPDALEGVSAAMLDDPTLPLNVRIWTDRSRAGDRAIYREGESIRLYLRGNKPFYARVMYRAVDGQTLQLLPNRHRRSNFFQGGTTYVIPTAEDDFILEVSPPFGAERVVVYASERPLGEIKMSAVGDVFLLDKTASATLDQQIRGVKIVGVNNKTSSGIAAEFSEYAVDLITTP